MRKFAVAAALAAVAVASPALAAGEARVEARGGIAWTGGDSEAIAGVAAGYDFDTSDTAFIGVEVSGDKLLVDGADVIFGFSGRIGAKVAESGRLYGLLGYSTGQGDAPHFGAGFEQKLGGNFYGKIEYRVSIFDEATIHGAGIGLGVKF